ncbi:MAG: Uma2 family endonuclease [Saprospiraceae bacterium]|nr:Uma2 family endonuclease [Saprospiraceae bacterium]
MTPPATVAPKYPVTLAERLELGPEPLRFPGSLSDFAELLDTCDYPIEFDTDHIIAMSIASDKHEQIVANVLGLLYNIYTGHPNYKRYGSNRHVFSASGPVAYAPDASVVRGEPDVVEYSPGKTANRNPWLIVEVQSESTRDRDWGDKLRHYKDMPSVEHILFIEQDRPIVNHFTRQENGLWVGVEYNALEHIVVIEGHEMRLMEVYENVLG